MISQNGRGVAHFEGTDTSWAGRISSSDYSLAVARVSEQLRETGATPEAPDCDRPSKGTSEVASTATW